MKTNMNELDKRFNNIDKKFQKMGLSLKTTKVKPCPEKFLFNTDKNSIIFNEDIISDECNYIDSIHKILNHMDPNKELYFINFAEYIPAVIIFYFQSISQGKKIFIFTDDIKEYESLNTENLKFRKIEQAEKLNLIKIKKD